jgi:hypothetical protein
MLSADAAALSSLALNTWCSVETRLKKGRVTLIGGTVLA